MKPLYILAAEERLKGQPPRHAKVYKDDISPFEADMIYIRNYLLANGGKSLGDIARATGIPKATVQKMLSPLGIKRVYNQHQLESMKARNSKRYYRVIAEHTGVVRYENGRWKGLEYRESDRERFKKWLLDSGYMLLDYYDKDGDLNFGIVKFPQDVEEELVTFYSHRFSRIPIEL